ncbi:MAG: ATP-dependent Clp protease adaptor ClpS [Deltaproteobacteria bacterium]|nr:ATP-dependent Clp protease adaptor ClpS [Deltaproteobacteria bacterium]
MAGKSITDQKTEIATATIPKPEFPAEWNVFILNDDVTPMTFVTRLLQGVFRLDYATAHQIMLAAHTTGRAHCGKYMKAVAEAKQAQCRVAAAEAGYPLKVIIEREGGQNG